MAPECWATIHDTQKCHFSTTVQWSACACMHASTRGRRQRDTENIFPAVMHTALAPTAPITCGAQKTYLLLCFEDPEELCLSILILAGAQSMSHSLQRVHKRACTVVCWVHLRRPAAALSQPCTTSRATHPAVICIAQFGLRKASAGMDTR